MDRAQIAIEAANAVASGEHLFACNALRDLGESVRPFAALFKPSNVARDDPWFGLWADPQACSARVIALCLYSLLIQDGLA